MEDQVVQLVIPVNNSRPGLRLIWKVLGIPTHKVVKGGYLSDGFIVLDVRHLGLCERNLRQGFYLAREIGIG